ncbi:DUF4233 domain-containing protein [Streptomyces sp. PT12]|uniref:DUF4233 domain-containing protein n=1 Tax=Streptomyces sp. PT12 TaxID=1510197 RepID=UPI000DE54EDC|nr:DUF4233 domain-containing protein [Streptomyces sp. PT12]RBM23631.1 DUF4233 domain-containing protein [Streptomyces sp. PT12]
MRTLCSATLVGEFIVIGLAGLVAMRTSDVPSGTLWAVSGTAMVLSLLLCGMVGRPGGVRLGWVLQAGLVASGFVIPAMFLLGTAFAALWWASVHYGRLVDQLKAARAASGSGAGAPVR